MYKYAYLFYVNNEFVLEEDLKEYLSEEYIKDKNNSLVLCQNMKITSDKNTIFIDKSITSKINIYTKNSIFIIFTNRVKDIKKFNFLLKYNPVNLVDNRFVKEIFKNGFSENLTMISIESDKTFGEESIDLVGNSIHSDNYFEEFGIFRSDSWWKIKEYGFQPIFSKHGIKVKEPNRIEFNKKMCEDEINSIIKKLLFMVRNY